MIQDGAFVDIVGPSSAAHFANTMAKVGGQVFAVAIMIEISSTALYRPIAARHRTKSGWVTRVGTFVVAPSSAANFTNTTAKVGGHVFDRD